MTIFFLVLIGSLIVYVLNLKVYYYQGINYRVIQKRIPLYLKIVDFFSRHCHYRELVKELIKDCKTEEEKIFAIFEWTHKSIKEAPEGFPILDDHVWNVIIRGYGTDDQSADVFATLCTYVGFPARWVKIYPRDSNVWIAVTFVKVNRNCFIFDPMRGNYFMNALGEIADVDDIMHDISIVLKADNKPVIHGIEYVKYFDNLALVQDLKFPKARFQMVFPRIIFEIKKFLSKY